MAQGFMSQKASTPMTPTQQRLVRDMEKIAQYLNEKAADPTLSAERRRNLLTRGLADLRIKRGELAADLFEQHAMASGIGSQRVQLIQGVRALGDSLQNVARDPRLTMEQRQATIDAHARLLAQENEGTPVH